MAESNTGRIQRMLSGGILGLAGVGILVNPDSELSRFLTLRGSEQSADETSMPHRSEVNEIGLKMLKDIAPYNPVDPDWALSIAQEKGSSVWLGEKISVSDAMRYNYIAGFRGNDLIIKTAIDGKESGYYPGAVGDVNWNLNGDRSIGTSQIYCQPNGSIGCGGERNWRENFNPMKNAENSYILYLQAWDWHGFGDDELGITGRFKPWESDPDATRKYYANAKNVYQELENMYGPLE